MAGVEGRWSPAPSHRRTILLCDSPGARRDLVANIIAQAGGTPWPIDMAATSDSSELPGCTQIGLIGFDASQTPDRAALELIQHCKEAGFELIAFGRGVKKWPVHSKCLPLVAGATHLLDSDGSEFGAELCGLLRRALEAAAGKQQERQEVGDLMRLHGMVGESPAFRSAFQSVLRFSELSDLPVLITGESGTGKELLARTIGRMDPKRMTGPFLAINCAAVSPALLESEFFGHRRGAFTGAERDRKGLIRAAEGGVLFLDEIGDLDLSLQAKLLRALQENCVLAVGEEQEAPIDVRFIAATNRNLEQLVAEGKFRGDLFHRLRVLTIHVTPLRERPADLLPLIEHFLHKHHRLHSTGVTGVSQDFLNAVQQLELQGNVRQLENLVRQSLVNHHSHGDLDLKDLPVDVLRQLTMELHGAGPKTGPATTVPQVPPAKLSQSEMNEVVKQILEEQGWNLFGTLRECERQVFEVAMARAQGNQAQAARLLGITARTVYNKLREHRLAM